MKIVLLDKKTLGDDINLDIFNTLGDFKTYDTTKSSETINNIGEAQIVLTNKVVIDKEVIDNTNIKLICVCATGTNNVDLEYAKKRNIIVKNVAGYSTNSVAQITLSLLHRAIQNIEEYNQYVKNNKWENSPIFTNLDNPFYEITNKNWGVIGLGNIGKKVADIAKAYGAKVSYYSTSGTNINNEYEKVSLDELIKNSDIITIHCPLNEKTKNLFNYENMKSLKDKAIVINVARGGIINESDLVKIIKEKSVTFALDTISTEPIHKQNPLNEVIKKKNLIITPHIAWSSIESRNDLIKKVYKNITDFLGV